MNKANAPSCVVIEEMPVNTQAIRLVVNTVLENDVLGEAVIPLPQRGSLLKSTQIESTEVIDYSFGIKLGELDVEINPVFQRFFFSFFLSFFV